MNSLRQKMVLKTKKITAKTSLAEILKIPGAEEILIKYNLPCLTCPAVIYEISSLKIGEVAKTYHLDLKNLLRELSKKLKKKDKK